MGILSSKAHIIVVANEKGGTGKSTLSMHLAVKLLYENFKVAVIDLDGRQGSLSKYIENRRNFCNKNNICLPSPVHYIFEPIAKEANKKEIEDLITELSSRFDAIIIDTPGGRNYLFDLAHKFLHTLITPIGDSLVDLSAIADINPDNGEIIKAGHYAEFVWETKKKLASKELPYLNWIVCGNKTSSLRSKNKEMIFSKLNSLAKLYGFRFTEGLKDRVIYKELFLDGLTILDMNSPKLHRRLSVSHLAAKMELNTLVEFIFP